MVFKFLKLGYKSGDFKSELLCSVATQTIPNGHIGGGVGAAIAPKMSPPLPTPLADATSIGKCTSGNKMDAHRGSKTNTTGPSQNDEPIKSESCQRTLVNNSSPPLIAVTKTMAAKLDSGPSPLHSGSLMNLAGFLKSRASQPNFGGTL